MRAFRILISLIKVYLLKYPVETYQLSGASYSKTNHQLRDDPTFNLTCNKLKTFQSADLKVIINYRTTGTYCAIPQPL